MKHIVTIGGGTGQFALLTGLKTIPDLDITAVVTMADSGGSSGVLRTERGVLPPGDIIRCLLALATADDDVIGLFHHRLTAGGGVGGHRIGNIALTGAVEQRDNDFLAGVATISKVLAVRGRVLPVTIEKTNLCARLADGTPLRCEHEIDQTDGNGRARITEVWLEPAVTALAEVLEVVRGADAIVAGPGDLYTSIIPNVLVGGVSDALRALRGKLIFVVNAMTKRGETDGLHARGFLEIFERYAGRRVDAVICNTRPPAPDIAEKYAREGAEFVPPTNGEWDDRAVIPFPLLTDGPLARHDPIKLAHVIRALL
ncbi:YvcK family protein [Candidatus Uhrbacteria bacterium]|nr:YvcK family protein [Candidatus Uhrbacteria bacterium]